MNKNQIFGIVLFISSIATSFIIDHALLETLMGVLSAVGIGLILKWIPFKKTKAAE